MTDYAGTLIKTIGDEVMVSFEDGPGLFEAGAGQRSGRHRPIVCNKCFRGCEALDYF